MNGEENELREKLEQMVNLHQLKLLRLCYAYLHDRPLAEDAVQETFLKAYKCLPSFKGECAESTWLTRIAINTCKDMRRSHWFRCVSAVTPDMLPAASESVTVEDTELTAEIMRLPVKLREAALLCWYQGLNHTEAAQVLGISQQAVSSRIDRARNKLQRILKESEGDDDEP